MQKGLTEIVMLIDRSGSMSSKKSDVIGGFNEFLKNQQELPGEASMSLIQFDDKYEEHFLCKSIKTIKPLDESSYIPRGMTALLDAVGQTIDAVSARIATADVKPERIILAINTDGHENASREYDKTRIFDMIQQKENDGWEVIFLGAGKEAFSESRKIGVKSSKAVLLSNDREGTFDNYQILSRAVTANRTTGGEIDLKTIQEKYVAEKPKIKKTK